MNPLIQNRTPLMVLATVAFALCLSFPGGVSASPSAQRGSSLTTDASVEALFPNAKQAMRSGRGLLRVHCGDHDCRVRARVSYERRDGRRIATEPIAVAAIPLGPRQVRDGVWWFWGPGTVPVQAGRTVSLPLHLVQTTDRALRRAAAGGGAVARIRVETLRTEESWSRISESESRDSYFPAPQAASGSWTGVGEFQVALRR